MKLSLMLFVLAAPVVFWNPVSLHAEAEGTTQPPALTLKDALAIAARDNPEIRAARSRWEAMKARVSQARTPDKPRIDIERMYAPQSENPVTGAEEKNIAVSQMLPFPTTLYLRGRQARQEAEQGMEAYRSKEWDVLTRVKTAYAGFTLAHDAIRIFEENIGLMRQFAQVAEARYASGTGSQGEALKAHVELSKMLNELVTLEQERDTHRAMLNTLLNRSPSAPLGVPETPKPELLKQDAKALEALALEFRPEIKEAEAALESSRTGVSLSRSEYLPDIMLQYRRRTMLSGPNSHDAMLGFSVPLYFWKQNAAVRGARAERDMAQAEYETMRNMALYDVTNLLIRTQTAHRLVELYRTSVLPQSQQALRTAEADHRSARIGFLDLLDAVRSTLNFNLEHSQHLALYAQFRAELEQAVGVNLDTQTEEQ